MTTRMTNAMHPPMIPHNSLFDRLDDPRASGEGGSFVSSVVGSVDLVAGGAAAEQNQTIAVFLTKHRCDYMCIVFPATDCVCDLALATLQ